MIQLQNLTKRFGRSTAVADLTVAVQPGAVTGFLGPNGAGKSTTMRMIVGLDRPTAGTALVDGRPYAAHRSPLHVVGSMLDSRAMHPGRSGRNHLGSLAATHRIPPSRVDEVLGVVGLAEVADHRAGTYSMGMSQRLGLAAALLGDPGTLVLDEPVNGLDPAGIHWMRALLRSLAAEGRTVFVSSHLMGEVALTADRVVVIGRGRILTDTTIDAFTAALETATRVGTSEPGRLLAAIGEAGADASVEPAGTLLVRRMEPETIANLALERQILLHELTPIRPSLEDAYLRLTADAVQYDSASVSTPLSAVGTPTEEQP
ncbi:MAG: ATP-binding cassette domain-containing protein [Acidimicrobiales bacterium]